MIVVCLSEPIYLDQSTNAFCDFAGSYRIPLAIQFAWALILVSAISITT